MPYRDTIVRMLGLSGKKRGLWFLALTLVFLACCETFVGNPEGGDGEPETAVEISNSAFSDATMALDDVPVSAFSLCIKSLKIRQETSSEYTVKEFRAGLIDVADGTAKTWGSINLPIGMQISAIEVVTEKDEDLCKVDYSVQFNSATTQEQTSLKWSFAPAIAVDSDTTLELSLSEVVTTLKKTERSGDSAMLKQGIEASQGKGEKGKKKKETSQAKNPKASSFAHGSKHH